MYQDWSKKKEKTSYPEISDLGDTDVEISDSGDIDGNTVFIRSIVKVMSHVVTLKSYRYGGLLF